MATGIHHVQGCKVSLDLFIVLGLFGLVIGLTNAYGLL